MKLLASMLEEGTRKLTAVTAGARCALGRRRAQPDPADQLPGHPSTLHPQSQPYTLNPQPCTLNLQPCTLNPGPWTLNPEP